MKKASNISLAALLFIFYPESGSGDLFPPYPEQVFRLVSVLYVVLSGIVVARSAFSRPEVQA